MMDLIDYWPHRWFGVWKEYGPSYEQCPSVQEFVCPAVAHSYDHKRLREYLTRAQVVASTSRSNFPSPFSGARSSGSISFRTDGAWIWTDDLPDDIEQHDVALPTSFLRQIEAHNYVPPFVDQSAIARLEWPPSYDLDGNGGPLRLAREPLFEGKEPVANLTHRAARAAITG